MVLALKKKDKYTRELSVGEKQVILDLWKEEDTITGTGHSPHNDVKERN